MCVTALRVFYLAVLLSALSDSLYGISCAQVFFYYQTYHNSDPFYIRVLVRLFAMCPSANSSGQ
jgi:hypothetical protein